MKLKNEIEDKMKENKDNNKEKKQYTLKEFNEIQKAKLVINQAINKENYYENEEEKNSNIKNLTKSSNLPPVKILKGD